MLLTDRPLMACVLLCGVAVVAIIYGHLPAARL
jgi:hypothetical protein